MLTLPDTILPVLDPFASLFRDPTWRKAQILLVGVILATGQRTVASTLRVMGLSSDRNYARYHHVLNRAVWSPLEMSRILLGLLIRRSESVPPRGPEKASWARWSPGSTQHRPRWEFPAGPGTHTLVPWAGHSPRRRRICEFVVVQRLCPLK